MMAIWVMGTFVKITIYYYAVLLGIAQWRSLSNYRPLVFPIGTAARLTYPGADLAF
ncbi:hypothetical protein [Paenibacillus periandrae]|uniref:hypothetical protein n=1 Tax=Paenibacillus periandrae TaxID=1761741 RepID=UPI00308467CC